MSATLERPAITGTIAPTPPETAIPVVTAEAAASFMAIRWEGTPLVVEDAPPMPERNVVDELAEAARGWEWAPERVSISSVRSLWDRLVQHCNGNHERATAIWRSVTCCTGMARQEFILRGR